MVAVVAAGVAAAASVLGVCWIALAVVLEALPAAVPDAEFTAAPCLAPASWVDTSGPT